MNIHDWMNFASLQKYTAILFGNEIRTSTLPRCSMLLYLFPDMKTAERADENYFDWNKTPIYAFYIQVLVLSYEYYVVPLYFSFF